MICNNVINVIKVEFLSHNTVVHLSGNRITKLICISRKKYKSIHSRLTLGNDMSQLNVTNVAEYNKDRKLFLSV